MAITSPNQLEARLKGKPDEWAQVIALRVALRVLPIALTSKIEFEDKFWTEDRFRLMVFRASLVSHVAVFHAYSLNIIVAGDAAAAIRAANAANAAAYAAVSSAAADAANTAAAAVRAAHAAYAANAAAATYAVQAAGAADIAFADVFAAAGVSRDEIWSLADQDVHALEAGAKVEKLANAPVFGSENSELLSLMKDRVSSFKNQTKHQPGWQVWADWYQAIAFGESVVLGWGREAELEIALKDDDFWERDPDLVNGDITEIIQNSGSSDDDRQSTADTPIVPEAATDQDLIGRKVLATALATHLKKMVGTQLKAGQANPDGFFVNLHAPWGAGKSSVMKMLKTQLIGNDSSKPGWIVVEFNAWRYERRNPPWWPLLKQMKDDFFKQLKPTHYWAQADSIQQTWRCEQFLSNRMPQVASLAMGLAALVMILVLAKTFDIEGVSKIGVFLTPMIALMGVIYAFSRGVVFGSKKNAETFEEMSRDPLGRISNVFETLLGEHDQPVCVMIDDLDRCNADYVVDFLEGLQTAFRHKRVVYLVAADRKWIKSAFEERYLPTYSQVPPQGQSLGYLFLEKMFQVSLPLPAMSAFQRANLWTRGITPSVTDKSAGVAKGPDAEEGPRAESETDNEAQARDEGQQAQRDLDQNSAQPDEPKGDDEQANQEKKIKAALKLAQDEDGLDDAKHVLEHFHNLIPPNPRTLKRTQNAFALRRYEVELIGDDDVTPQSLARWLILEQSTPDLADMLTENPGWVSYFSAKHLDKDGADETVLKALQPYLNDQGLVDIICTQTQRVKGEDIDFGQVLTEKNIRLFTATAL